MLRLSRRLPLGNRFEKPGRLFRGLELFVVFWLLGAPSWAQVELPTPLDHYEEYDPESAGRELLREVLSELPEQTRALASALLQSDPANLEHELTVEQAQQVLAMIDWERHRPQVLMLFLHASRVLEVVPESTQDWIPIVHDSLLLFLDRLSERRLVERIIEQMNLPRDAGRGERILAFIAETPSLQKLAQILARNQALAPDIRQALQRVENSLSTMNYKDVLAQIEAELDPEVAAQYNLRFSEKILAEASVGAVLKASFEHPGTGEPGEAACKVLKPNAVAALKEDLHIIDDVLAFLEDNSDFYGLGNTPLVEIFKEIREALSREILVEDERRNLIRAGEYYRLDPKVIIPEVYPFSTPNVTCMEFIPGEKITDAFPGQAKERAHLARQLSDVLTFDVLFSPQDNAIFHGDPHAGNVFHVEDQGEDRYRIALLDWGLSAEFTRENREKLIQLLLGLYLQDGKRLANNLDGLVAWQPESPEDRQAMREKVEVIISDYRGEQSFAVLNELISTLARDGYSIQYEMAIFIKSQLTISGILTELDPDFKQDQYVMGRMSGQVYKELHTRLLRTIYFPAWNSHNYRSMLSNEDVKDVQFKRIGGGFKSFGKGIWYGVSFGWLRSSGPSDPSENGSVSNALHQSSATPRLPHR
jgi:ubiquinone biosynthesis protein